MALYKSKYQEQLQKNIATVIKDASTNTTDAIDKELIELQKELVKKASHKEAYDEIADKIFELREKRQLASLDTAQRDEQLNRITELQDFIKDQETYLKEFDESLVRRWLKQITIFPDYCRIKIRT